MSECSPERNLHLHWDKWRWTAKEREWERGGAGEKIRMDEERWDRVGEPGRKYWKYLGVGPSQRKRPEDEKCKIKTVHQGWAMKRGEKPETDETFVAAESKEPVKEKGAGDKEIWSWMQTETRAQINGCWQGELRKKCNWMQTEKRSWRQWESESEECTRRDRIAAPRAAIGEWLGRSPSKLLWNYFCYECDPRKNEYKQ